MGVKGPLRVPHGARDGRVVDTDQVVRRMGTSTKWVWGCGVLCWESPAMAMAIAICCYSSLELGSRCLSESGKYKREKKKEFLH